MRCWLRGATLERHYATLTISHTHTLTKLAILLVGDRIFDVGLLDALAAAGELMPAAPPRPSPTDPQARYYFWLIAGEAAQLGRYGQRVTALPWPGWELATFGQYQLDGQPNTALEALEVRVQECPATAQDTTPAALCRRIRAAPPRPRRHRALGGGGALRRRRAGGGLQSQ